MMPSTQRDSQQVLLSNIMATSSQQALSLVCKPFLCKHHAQASSKQIDNSPMTMDVVDYVALFFFIHAGVCHGTMHKISGAHA